MFQFEKATKSKSKLRLAIFGPSGAGKTYTALRMAKGIGGEVAVIDTERGSASKYADRFEFDVLNLPKTDINTYIAAIQAAGNKYNVLIIDSLTHAWKELLDEVEKLAKAKYRGNTWSAWSEGTPKQNKMINAILDFQGHVIVTMRSKTEWTTQSTNKGTTRPVRVGLAPEQGKGIEYEFDILMELSVEHIAQIIKDRTGKFQDVTIEKPDENFGKELNNWLLDGKNIDKNSNTAVEPENTTGKVVEPEPEPATETPANGRPYQPSVLIEKLRLSAQDKLTKNNALDMPVHQKVAQVLGAKMPELFDKNKEMYHSFLNDIFPQEGEVSANNLRHYQGITLGTWLFGKPLNAIGEGKPKDWFAAKIDSMATKEAQLWLATQEQDNSSDLIEVVDAEPSAPSTFEIPFD